MGIKKTNVKRVNNSKQNAPIGLEEHDYVADNNETCKSTVEKVHVCDGKADALASLKNPYKGCEQLVPS